MAQQTLAGAADTDQVCALSPPLRHPVVGMSPLLYLWSFPFIPADSDFPIQNLDPISTNLGISRVAILSSLPYALPPPLPDNRPSLLWLYTQTLSFYWNATGKSNLLTDKSDDLVSVGTLLYFCVAFNTVHQPVSEILRSLCFPPLVSSLSRLLVSSPALALSSVSGHFLSALHSLPPGRPNPLHVLHHCDQAKSRDMMSSTVL